MRGDEKDVPVEKVDPCAVCGRPSGCATWGVRLCYGDNSGRLGCVTQLGRAYAEAPDGADLRALTHTWVRAQKGRAA
jgi:hypothetical protein